MFKCFKNNPPKNKIIETNDFIFHELQQKQNCIKNIVMEKKLNR